MIIYLCIKFESNTLTFSKDIERKPLFKVENFSKLKKGHNSQNNWWILPSIELDLHFMIIYLCIKFHSNTPIFLKDIARKPFVLRTGQDRTDGIGPTDVRTAVILYTPPHTHTHHPAPTHTPLTLKMAGA